MCVAPSVSVATSMLPAAVGARRHAPSRRRLCSALPPAFAAVTVTVALPAATAVSVS